MNTKPAVNVGTDSDLLELQGPVSRVIRARVSDPDLVDELVQETLTRVIEARWRLERETLAAYAVTVARNLVTSHERADEMRQRHASRLVEPADGADDPEQAALEAEERAAMTAALASLSQADRELLVAHEVNDSAVDKLAAERGITPAALAARLARGRARLRVGYLLMFRHVRLPTRRCRPVLEALALGDRRRQASLRAGEHLAACVTCAELAEPLARRRRSLTGILPVAWLVAAFAWLRRWARAHPAKATVSAALASTLMVVGVAGVITTDRPAVPPPPVASAQPSPTQPASPAPTATASAPTQPPGTLFVAGRQVLPGAAGTLREYAGQRAVAVSVRVVSVPADEGFWVGTGPGQRSWVQFITTGESRPTIRPGMSLSFAGTVTMLRPDLAARVGLANDEGAGELAHLGAMIRVRLTDLLLR